MLKVLMIYFLTIVSSWSTYIREGSLWETRPEEVSTKIDRTFNQLKSIKSSEIWTVNGRDHYGVGRINAHKLIEDQIKKAPSLQVEFYVLDAGAGEFQWGRALEKYINAVEFEREFTLHIISVIAEQFNGESKVVSRNCIRYEEGQFKLENVESELRNNIAFRDIKFDVIVSSWCLQHLIDCPGTLEQLYNRVKTKGFILFHRFDLFLEFEDGEREWDAYGLIDMLCLLQGNKPPFLIHPELSNCQHGVVLQKPDERDLQLPFIYNGLYDRRENGGNGYKAKFKCLEDYNFSFAQEKLEPLEDVENAITYEKLNKINRWVYGDQALFEYFKRNQLFFKTKRNIFFSEGDTMVYKDSLVNSN